jgi:hypothetical protein
LIKSTPKFAIGELKDQIGTLTLHIKEHVQGFGRPDRLFGKT